MKKKLDTTAITNELKGASAFFPDYKGVSPSPDEPERATPPATGADRSASSAKKDNGDTMIPRHHDTTTPRNRDTMIPVDDADLFEGVRKAVKQIGKEAATHRFTEVEKESLRELEFAYRKTGIRTSENEITRIAINYLVEDHRLHGEKSVLTKVLKRLNS